MGRSHWSDLLLGLAGRGHHVTLLCNRRLVAEAAQARGVETRLLRLGGDLAVHDAVRLALVLRRQRPDVFIVGTFRKLWLAAAAARMAKVPNLVSRLGLSTDTPRNFKYRFVLRRWVDHVVFVADVMRKSYIEAFPELAHRLTTISKGVPPLGPRFTQEDARWALGLPADVPLLGSVSRLVPQKRLGRLLEAQVFLHETPPCHRRRGTTPRCPRAAGQHPGDPRSSAFSRLPTEHRTLVGRGGRSRHHLGPGRDVRGDARSHGERRPRHLHRCLGSA